MPSASAKLSVPETCPAAKAVRARRSTTHSPASIARRSSVLDARRGGVRSGRRRAGRVRRGHVRVVGGVGVQAGQQPGHVGCLVVSQGRIDASFSPDRRETAFRLRGCAEAAEAVGRVHRRIVGQYRREAMRGCVLRPGQLAGMRCAEQVWSPGRAIQQRAAGEDAGRPISGRYHVGQVGVSVAGGSQYLHFHQRADFDHVAIADSSAVEGDGVSAVHVVPRAGGSRQRQSSRDVVVVQVGLEHVPDLHAEPARQGQNTVDVALRVHDDRSASVMREIAAIAERGCLHRDDLHAGPGDPGHFPPPVVSPTAWTASRQIPLPVFGAVSLSHEPTPWQIPPGAWNRVEATRSDGRPRIALARECHAAENS